MTARRVLATVAGGCVGAPVSWWVPWPWSLLVAFGVGGVTGLVACWVYDRTAGGAYGNRK